MDLKYEHLLGREYEAGTVHCYSLVRDFYRDNFGILGADYAIPHDLDADVLNLVGLLHEREGMEKVENWTLKSLQPGDVLCTAIRAANPNHLVVYVGGNTVVHHLRGRTSCAEPLRDFWRMVTCFILRHPDVPDLRPTLSQTTIMDLARARYFPETAA